MFIKQRIDFFYKHLIPKGINLEKHFFFYKHLIPNGILKNMPLGIKCL